MRILLWIGGILLIFGTVLFSTSAYVSISNALTEAVTGWTAEGYGWSQLAPLIGLALMGLGVLAAVVVLIILLRAVLTAPIYAGYGEGSKSNAGARSVQSAALSGKTRG